MNKTDSQFNKKALDILSIGHLTSDAYGGFILPIMPIIAAKLNISLGVVGLLLGISSLSSSILQPLFGYISDLINKKVFIISGLILSSVFISLTGLISNIWILAIVIFIGSMGVGLFHPQATSYAGYYSGVNINKYMGIYTAYGTIGYAIGPFFSSVLVENFGITSTIYAVIPGLIMLYLASTKIPSISFRPNHTKREINFDKILSLKKILATLAFIAIIRALIVTSFDVFMPFIWTKQHISVIFIGILIGSFSFLGGISSYIAGRLSNILSKKVIIVFSFIFAIPCLLGSLYFIKHAIILSFILFVMSGIFIMSSMSVNLVMGQLAIPENAGIVSGIIGGFSWGIAGLLQYPIGFLSTQFGIIPVLTAISITPILGVICAFSISKEYA